MCSITSIRRMSLFANKPLSQPLRARKEAVIKSSLQNNSLVVLLDGDRCILYPLMVVGWKEEDL